MNKNVTSWLTELNSTLLKVHEYYINNKGMILTEGDLHCLIYKFLSESSGFNNIENTMTSDWRSSKIHSEVTWFKGDNDSGFEVDLTILNPSNLDINNLEMVADYPNKGFFYDGDVIGIELKFIRDDSTVDDYAVKDYNKIVDSLLVEKINQIRNKRYKNISESGLAFVVIICCKSSLLFKRAKQTLNTLTLTKHCPDNVFPVIFGCNKNNIYYVKDFPN